MQNSDIHSIVILEGPPKTHIVVVVNAVHVSYDDGATWKSFDAAEAFGLRYSRIAQVQPGSNHVFLRVGDGTPGTTTKIWRSHDLGALLHRSWLRAKSAYGGGRSMFDHEVSQAQPVQAREAEEVPTFATGRNTTKGCAAGAI